MLTKHLVELLEALAAAGLDVSVDETGDGLRLSPADRLDDDMRASLRRWKPQLLDVLGLQRHGVADRAALMRGLRYHVLIPGLPYRRGWCFSCWAALPPSTMIGRCQTCAEALQRVLTTIHTETEGETA
jgi:hypothetical protein